MNAKANAQGGSLHEREEGKTEMSANQHNLETLVSERTSELKTTNERLEEEISQHKQLQIEIARLSQFRETVIDAADIWLFVTDKNSNIVIWNRAAEKISGYSRQEVVGGKKPWLSLYPDHAYRKKIGDLLEKEQMTHVSHNHQR